MARTIREYWVRIKYDLKFFVKSNEQGVRASNVSQGLIQPLPILNGPQFLNANEYFMKDDDIYVNMKKRMEDAKHKEKQEAFLRNNWIYLEPKGEKLEIAGPISIKEMIDNLTKQVIDESFYAWHPSLKNWEQIIDIPQFDDKNIRKSVSASCQP